MQVRLIDPDVKVSTEIYEQADDATPDSKGKIEVIDSKGNKFLVQYQRIVSLDSLNKAVVIPKGDRTIGFCPKCSRPQEVNSNKLHCEEHGVFETVDEVIVKPIRTKKKSKRTPKEIKMSDAAETKQEKKGPVQCDLNEIAKYGELWTRSKVNFDHAKIDVNSHMLISDEPLRKLPFNTYNGTLGKKSKDPIGELKLEKYKSMNADEDEKVLWHAIKKGTIDDLRKFLENKGYKKHGSTD